MEVAYLVLFLPLIYVVMQLEMRTATRQLE
jgi:hypothetical protein